MKKKSSIFIVIAFALMTVFLLQCERGCPDLIPVAQGRFPIIDTAHSTANAPSSGTVHISDSEVRVDWSDGSGASSTVVYEVVETVPADSGAPWNDPDCL